MPRTLDLLREVDEGRASVADSPHSSHTGRVELDGATCDYLFAHPPSSIEFTIPSAGFSLSFGVMLHPEVWDKAGVRGCRFVVRVDDDALLTIDVDPARNEAHRKRLDYRLSVPPGRESSRVLRLETQGVGGEDHCWALWVRPVVEIQGDAPDHGDGVEAPAHRGSIRYPMLLPRESRVLFVAGSMKSGTTWLMNLMNRHPEICCRGEMHPVGLIDAAVAPYTPLPSLETVAMNAAGLRQWYAMPNSSWHVGGHDGMQDMQTDYVRFFFEWTILKWFDSQGERPSRVIADKSPAHGRSYCKRLHHYFGEYRPFVLHIVRDPRDVAVSLWFHLRRLQHQGRFEWVERFRGEDDRRECARLMEDPEAPGAGRFFQYPEFLQGALQEWVDVNQSLTEDGPRLFGDQYLMVSYESLKAGASSELADIFKWLGVRSSAEVVDGLIREDSRAEKPSVFRKGAVGDWKTYFDDEAMRTFERVARESSGALGYS